jgi:hypothetical protein
VIITSTPPPALAALRRAVFVGLLAGLSWAVATAFILYGDNVAIFAVFGVIAALAVWRPRYGIYATLILAFMFEPLPFDPIMAYGWFIHSNISSWTPFGFINFSFVELSVLTTALAVVMRAVIERRALRSMRLMVPLLIFLSLMIGSVGWGILRNGSLNLALWEVRYLFLGGVLALLVPNVFTNRGQVQHAVNLICFAVIILSLQGIWRYYGVLGGTLDEIGQESAYAHETPILMNVVVILLIARLIWPASPRARIVALAVPVILFAEMLTERRAGWVSLDIGLILLAIFMFRLKRKAFYLLVVPLLFVYVGYLGAFWNASGPLAEPARAVRSINDPEGRDMSSNLARQMEMGNIRYNIHANPLTGLGFGRPYVDVVGEFNLSWWPFWHYFAHCSILWIWLKMGVFGFVLFFTLVGAGIVHGIHILKRSSHERTAPILVALVSALMMVMVYAWVDLGLMNVRTTILLGFALGAIGVWEGLPDEAAKESP